MKFALTESVDWVGAKKKHAESIGLVEKRLLGG